MIEDASVEGDEQPFARSYDYFKHLTGVSLVSLGGVFAFVGGNGLQFNRRTLIVVLAFIGVGAITSFLMAGGLAGLETRPEPREVTVRKIRVANVVVAFSLAGGLGGFAYNFTAALLK